MKVLKILGIVVAVIVVLLGGALLYLTRYLKTPEFKQKVLAAAKEELHTDVVVQEMDVSLFEGVTLRGVRIANPKGFDGDFLSAGSFVLRYRFWPLLRKRVEIERVTFEKPSVTMVRSESDIWNYEPLFKSGGESGTSTSGGTTTQESSSGGGSVHVALQKLSVSDGAFALLRAGNKNLIRVDGMQVNSSVDYGDDKFGGGEGTAKITSLNVADWLFLKNLSAPVKFASKGIELKPLHGSVAGGTADGDAALQFLGGFRYKANLAVKDVSVDELLAEAKTKRLLNGTMQGTVSLEGTGGVSTMKGDGKLLVTNGKLAEIPLQRLVATLLQVPELQEIKFDECALEFTMADGKMPTPVFRLKASRIEITAKGVLWDPLESTCRHASLSIL